MGFWSELHLLVSLYNPYKSVIGILKCLVSCHLSRFSFYYYYYLLEKYWRYSHEEKIRCLVVFSHCWSALNLSPGRVPSALWSSCPPELLWSNRHWDWDVLESWNNLKNNLHHIYCILVLSVRLLMHFLYKEKLSHEFSKCFIMKYKNPKGITR